jgi:hypothetical protein
VQRQSFISGLLRGGQDLQVQALKRRPSGRWIVLPGPSASTRPSGTGATEWSLPIELEGLDEPESIMCVCVGDRLPPGMVVDPRWRGVVAESAALEISCQRFDRGRLRVISIGERPAIPNVPMPVAEFEPVKILVQGFPLGTIVQIVTEPQNNSRFWCSERLEVTRDSIVLGNAYFGRLTADASAKRELDIHAQFWMWAVASVRPLPARLEGIGPREWLRLSPHIRGTSPKISAVRAVLPWHVRLHITHLGSSNDGRRWLAPRFSRVEGTFIPGERYRPLRPEIITLLVRSADTKNWSVGAATNLTNNRALWIMPVSDLLPPNANPERESMVAVVVASYLPFDSLKPVTAADIGARMIAISEEMTYRIIPPRSGQ